MDRLNQWSLVFVVCALAGVCHPHAACLGASVTNAAPAAKSNWQNGVIATAMLISTSQSTATYKLIDIWHGSTASNVVRVIFYPKTVPKGGCPERAILLLEKVEKEDGWPSNWLFAIGRDAALGCLPYSEERWAEIRRHSPSVWMQTREENRIAESKAIEIATKELLSERLPNDGETMHSEARRYNFGWSVDFSFILKDGHSVLGSDVTIIVGDDGRVKVHEHGL